MITIYMNSTSILTVLTRSTRVLFGLTRTLKVALFFIIPTRKRGYMAGKMLFI